MADETERVHDGAAVEALCLSRAYLYTLFAKAFSGEPTPELLVALCSQAAKDAIEEYSDHDEIIARYQGYIDQLKEKRLTDESFFESVRNEYSRMFFGFDNGSFPLAESAYRCDNGGYFDETTLAVRRCYRREGLLPAKYPRVPDDHIALELGFMAIMASHSLEALKSGNSVMFSDSMVQQRAFITDHLLGWIDQFAERLKEGKTTMLYPQIAAAAAAFVGLDAIFAEQAESWALAMSDKDGTAFQEALDIDPDMKDIFDHFFEEIEACRNISLPYMEENSFREMDIGE